jgi:hypothetical protein
MQSDSTCPYTNEINRSEGNLRSGVGVGASKNAIAISGEVVPYYKLVDLVIVCHYFCHWAFSTVEDQSRLGLVQ